LEIKLTRSLNGVAKTKDELKEGKYQSAALTKILKELNDRRTVKAQ